LWIIKNKFTTGEINHVDKFGGISVGICHRFSAWIFGLMPAGMPLDSLVEMFQSPVQTSEESFKLPILCIFVTILI
jgi:hypothetical protein